MFRLVNLFKLILISYPMNKNFLLTSPAILGLQIFLISILTLVLTGNSYAGAWTLKRGQLLVKTSLLYQKTTDRYYSRNTPCPAGHNCTSSGQRVPFPFDGESKVTAVYLDLDYGLTDRLQLGVQIPYFDIEFEDLANPDRPKSTDIGDIRFGAKYRFFTNPIVSTIGIAAKAPTGFFNKDAEVVPVGDGQWDLEFTGQFGRSLWPVRGYVNLDIGYRLRFTPDIETSTLDPGNEFFFRGEGGYSVSKILLLKVVLSGLYGGKFLSEDLTILDSQREVLFLEPGIYLSITDNLAFESSVQFSLSGKNYTAGEVFNVGLSYSLSLLK